MQSNCDFRSELNSFINYFESLKSNNNQLSYEIGDQVWLNQWLESGFGSDSHHRYANLSQTNIRAFNKLTFNQFSQLFKSVFNRLLCLDQKYNYLNENIDNIDDQEWDQIIDEINKQKMIITEKISLIRENMQSIEQKLNKVKKKSNAKVERIASHRKLNQISNDRKHKLINEWFDDKQNNQIKRNIDFIKDLKTVSMEVKKKINETKQCLRKVNSIEKTRKCLKKSDESHYNESDINFTNKITEIKDSLRERLEIYRKEENALKNMVQKKCEKANSDERTDPDKYQDIIHDLLLGSDPYPEPNNYKSLMNWQFYEQCHHSIDNMTAIRHSWDKCLDMSNGSPIPKTFVLPNFKPNHLWSKYVESENSFCLNDV